MERENFRPGQIVRHFKRETVDQSTNLYTYCISGIAENTETREKLVVYTSLYDDVERNIPYGKMFVKPLDMFMSEVDHDKYPDIKQKYRFEAITDNTEIINITKNIVGQHYEQQETNFQHINNMPLKDFAKFLSDVVLDGTTKIESEFCNYHESLNGGKCPCGDTCMVLNNEDLMLNWLKMPYEKKEE